MSFLVMNGIIYGVVGSMLFTKYLYDKLVYNIFGNKKIIFSNKYECKNPGEAQAWLCITTNGINYYMYPFDYMDYCMCETKKLWSVNSSFVVFNYNRVPISTGGFPSYIEDCKEIGKQWLQNNFERNFQIVNNHPMINNILQLSDHERKIVLQKCMEEYIKTNKVELSFLLE